MKRNGSPTLKALCQTAEGPNGKAEIYEITHRLCRESRAGEEPELPPVVAVVYEVRCEGRRPVCCVDEDEATAVAAALAGVPFGPVGSIGMD